MNFICRTGFVFSNLLIHVNTCMICEKKCIRCRWVNGWDIPYLQNEIKVGRIFWTNVNYTWTKKKNTWIIQFNSSVLFSVFNKYWFESLIPVSTICTSLDNKQIIMNQFCVNSTHAHMYKDSPSPLSDGALILHV